MKINTEEIKRAGNHIRLGQGRTATEGSDGLPTLVIRENGKVIKRAKGSSLVFSEKLTDGDRSYLVVLGSDQE